MSRFLLVPIDRLAPDTLVSLLEEFASRDGTDYGAREFSLEEKVEQLRGQLADSSLKLIYDSEGETWDLMEAEQADALADS
ncbi:MAG: YheU family protein [Halioglobus sp.]